MIEEQDRLLNELKQSVLNFEHEERDLESIEQSQIDYFGYACLSNSLMYKEPTIPQHDSKGITEYFQTHTITTLESLILYIKNLSNDIDKLFAIFAWEALNIQYDVSVLLTGKRRDTSLEDIFNNKAAVSEGYALFFIEMAKAVNVNHKKIKIQTYSSFSKAFGYDPLNLPNTITPDHTSLFITIDKTSYISEPAWAAGHLNQDNQFEWNYRPDMFLVPVYKTLCDRMPCSESESLLPFKFLFDDFFKACRISPIGLQLKTESNPFAQVKSADGYVSQIYSCIAPINWIQIHLHKQDENDKTSFNEIPNECITSFEIVQETLPNHPDRCRFRTNISLPEDGFYRADVFIDGPLQITYYIESLSKSDISVPVTYNPFHDSKFIPIKPTRVISKVRHGVALIRFAVSVKKSDILWNIMKLKDPNSLVEDGGETVSRECGKFIKLKIPFDETRYEDQLCITFPSDGRYSIQIYLSNDVGSYSSHTKYFLDVSGTEMRDAAVVVAPIDFLFNDRSFAPVSAVDDDKKPVKVTPNSSFNIINQSQLDQIIQIETNSNDPNIFLEFRKDKEVIAVPELSKKDQQKFTFKWKVPDNEDDYQLFCWINEAFSFSSHYVYRKAPLREPTENEKNTLLSLQNKVELDTEYEASRNVEDKNDTKNSSKCCLLI